MPTNQKCILYCTNNLPEQEGPSKSVPVQLHWNSLIMLMLITSHIPPLSHGVFSSHAGPSSDDSLPPDTSQMKKTNTFFVYMKMHIDIESL